MPGDVLRVDGQASVQFGRGRGLIFRVITVSSVPTYAGWVWLTGYVLDDEGLAVERREIYVQHAGLALAVPRRRVSRQAISGRRPATIAPGRPRRAAAASIIGGRGA